MSRAATILLSILLVGVLAAAEPVDARGSARRGGPLDRSFSRNGKKQIRFPGTQNVEANAVAVQPNGRILVAGGVFLPDSKANFYIVRLTRKGALDRSFGGGDGIRRLNFSRGQDAATDLVLQPNGKIVVVGYADCACPHYYELAAARLLPSGRLDDSFSGDGKKTFNFYPRSSNDAAEAVTLDRRGRIVIAGAMDSGDGIALARLRRNGRLDRRFGRDGLVATKVRDRQFDANAVAVQGRRIVVGGNEFAAARYGRRGRLDQRFGGDGFARENRFIAEHVSVLGDERILSIGDAQTASGFAATRLRPGGAPDRRYGKEGLAVIPRSRFAADPTGGTVHRGKAIIVGEAVLHAGTDRERFVFGVARLRRRGRVDRTFAGDGMVKTSIGSASRAVDADVGPNRKIVVVGPTGHQRIGIVRYPW